jgi:hypothetical protein
VFMMVEVQEVGGKFKIMRNLIIFTCKQIIISRRSQGRGDGRSM